MWASLLNNQVPHEKVEFALEDEHHQLLLQMDELQRQITNQAPSAKQRLTLHMLDSYLMTNSLGEEALMFACSFPCDAAHREEHRAHHHALRIIDGHIISAEPEAALSGLAALRQIMLTHIREKDQEILDWKRNHKIGRRTDS